MSLEDVKCVEYYKSKRTGNVFKIIKLYEDGGLLLRSHDPKNPKCNTNHKFKLPLAQYSRLIAVDENGLELK